MITEKLLEFKAKAYANVNFFELMAPFSRSHLQQRFGSAMFSKHNVLGSCLTFTYVIYSRNSMSRFLKCLKKLNLESEDDFLCRLARKNTPDAIYQQYLKALSSRANLVQV